MLADFLRYVRPPCAFCMLQGFSDGVQAAEPAAVASAPGEPMRRECSAAERQSDALICLWKDCDSVAPSQPKMNA